MFQSQLNGISISLLKNQPVITGVKMVVEQHLVLDRLIERHNSNVKKKNGKEI